jgi:hypothetical protein
MVDKNTTPRNVVNLGSFRQTRRAGARTLTALAVSARSCRYCGAVLGEGEFEDECSSAFNDAGRPLARFRATPER